MGFTSVIRSMLALAAAMLLGGVLLAAAPTASAAAASSTDRAEQPAQTERRACQPRRCFGAVSLNTRTGVVGFANDKGSKSKAISLAHSRCKNKSGADGFPGQCKRAGWVRNGCLALAVRINNGALVEWGSAYAYNVDPAKRKAKQKVQGPGNVRIQFWLCTTRRR
jgi:hypothetical protein